VFLVDRLILIAGMLMVAGTLSSKFSERLGVPVLVLFLALGMLVGSEGPGGVDFENYRLAHGIGTVALALILFDGGLRTPLTALRVAWKPGVLLATLGVLITSAVTGAVAAFILDIPLLEGLLLGSIVGSTDAAAVLSILRSAGMHLRSRVAATLEVESGANDPMAIFLTIGLIELILGEAEPGLAQLQLFVVQMGGGLAAGLLVGRLSVSLVNRINLEAAGLYPVLTASCGAVAYGAAASFGGSGFLSIYVAGIVIGNSRLVFRRGTFLFQDGMAWIGQIVMFVVLGLLANPSELLRVGARGVVITLALIFLARPLAVAPILLPLRFAPREVLFVSWIGLKGAVPIVLATFPLLYGLPNGPLLFNVIFFVVLVSAVVQGSSVKPVARFLGLEEPPEPEPPITLELNTAFDVDADVVEYFIAEDSDVAGSRLNQIGLSDGAVVAMIVRDRKLIPPRGSTEIHSGDYVFVVVRHESRAVVDRIFSKSGPHGRMRLETEDRHPADGDEESP
jgi:potassium/hydrogen antiporter